MRITILAIFLLISQLSFTQQGYPTFNSESSETATNTGYYYDFAHSTNSNVLCDGIFNIFRRQGTLVALDSNSIRFSFSDTSILNPSVANKFIGNSCKEFYSDIDLSQNPFIEVEVSASQDCQVGFLVAGILHNKYTYADGKGYKLQNLKAGQRTKLRFMVPSITWKREPINLKELKGWGVQVKGPNGEPLPALHQSRRIQVYYIKFGSGSIKQKEETKKVDKPDTTSAPEEKSVVIAPKKEPIKGYVEISDSPTHNRANTDENGLPIHKHGRAAKTTNATPQNTTFQDAAAFHEESLLEEEKHQTIDLGSENQVHTVYIQPSIDFVKILSSSFEEIEVINLVGEKMSIPIKNKMINISTLPKGVYSVKQGDVSTRIVK